MEQWKHAIRVGFNFKSEARRYFLFFRPKNIVVDENFRIIAHLENFIDKEFPGAEHRAQPRKTGDPTLAVSRCPRHPPRRRDI
ncbi:MAG: hypothetical protein ACFFDN_33520 [Candidatus Hodarchaeota archaeon]